MKKRIFSAVSIIICIIVLLPLCTAIAAAEESGDEADNFTLYPEVNSENAIVVYNIESAQVLFSQRGDDVVSPTVATKLLSMMVVSDLFEENDIYAKTQKVEVDAKSLTSIRALDGISAPRLGLTAGNSFTADDLINATLVANANDACNALAYYCSKELMDGTIESFVTRMNEKAAEIGAEKSHFKNATGLDINGMETTPMDVALIAAEFYKYNDLFLISNKPSFKFNGKNVVHTKNFLLSDSIIKDYKNNDALGMIAGQRCSDGDYALITATEKDGLAYIIVVMEASGEIRKDGIRSFGEGNAYDDMKNLLEWTRKSFGYQTLANENELITELRVDMGKNFDHVSVVPEKKVELLVNKKIDSEKIERQITLDSEIVYKGEHDDSIVDMVTAPITKGQVLGTMTFSFEGENIGSVNLIAQNTVDSSGLLSTANKIKDFLFGSTMRTILIIFGVIIVVYIIFSIIAAIIRAIKKIKKEAKKNEEQ